MNNLKCLGTANKVLKRVMFATRKRSPEILILLGIGGMVGGTVMACIASSKVEPIVEEAKKDVADVHERIETQTEEDRMENAKALCVVYTKTGLRFVKLYGPAVAVCTLSILSILASNTILRKRAAALAAAYTTVSEAFKGYRGRVVDRFGEEVDRELRYNIHKEKIEETVTDENGKEKKVKTTVDVADLNEYSDYARFFDECSRYYEKNAELNLTFLKMQQAFANDKLKANGHLFLNEVYDMLDISRTKEGQIVGWLYDTKNPHGDNYVDFNIYDAYRKSARDFVNGYERSILLDFNVDGNIIDCI